MASIVLLPQIGISEESAVVAAWHFKVGDSVKVGDTLFTVETGKASFDVAAETGGTLLAIYVPVGEEKPIKAPVCAIGEAGEAAPSVGETPAASADAPAAPQTASDTPPQAVSQTAPQPSPAAPSSGISPRAKNLAEKAGVDAALASPTGPEGRIIERDVRALIERGEPSVEAAIGRPQTPSAPQSPAAEYTDAPHSVIRKVIAKNMTESLRTLAQLTHHHSFDAARLLALRARCKESADPAVKAITIGDLILFAVSRTLIDHPDLNAHYFDTHLRRYSRVGLGVAVDTPRGLMVPTIVDADRKSVRELSRELKALAAGCQAGQIDTSPVATFTVSNLGNLGVEMFTPVINPPQTGILGVCGVTYRVKADGSPYPAMGLSLTYDHRAVDGAPASRFLQDLCSRLENIDIMFL